MTTNSVSVIDNGSDVTIQFAASGVASMYQYYRRTGILTDTIINCENPFGAINYATHRIIISGATELFRHIMDNACNSYPLSLLDNSFTGMFFESKERHGRPREGYTKVTIPNLHSTESFASGEFGAAVMPLSHTWNSLWSGSGYSGGIVTIWHSYYGNKLFLKLDGIPAQFFEYLLHIMYEETFSIKKEDIGCLLSLLASVKLTDYGQLSNLLIRHLFPHRREVQLALPSTEGWRESSLSTPKSAFHPYNRASSPPQKHFQTSYDDSECVPLDLSLERTRSKEVHPRLPQDSLNSHSTEIYCPLTPSDPRHSETFEKNVPVVYSTKIKTDSFDHNVHENKSSCQIDGSCDRQDCTTARVESDEMIDVETIEDSNREMGENNLDFGRLEIPLSVTSTLSRTAEESCPAGISCEVLETFHVGTNDVFKERNNSPINDITKMESLEGREHKVGFFSEMDGNERQPKDFVHSEKCNSESLLPSNSIHDSLIPKDGGITSSKDSAELEKYPSDIKSDVTEAGMDDYSTRTHEDTIVLHVSVADGDVAELVKEEVILEAKANRTEGMEVGAMTSGNWISDPNSNELQPFSGSGNHFRLSEELDTVPWLKCISCSLTFKHEKGIIAHIKACHFKPMGKVRTIPCLDPSCPVQLVLTSYLWETHILHHVVKYPLSCNYCTYSTKTPSGITMHHAAHKGNVEPQRRRNVGKKSEIKKTTYKNSSKPVGHSTKKSMNNASGFIPSIISSTSISSVSTPPASVSSNNKKSKWLHLVSSIPSTSAAAPLSSGGRRGKSTKIQPIGGVLKDPRSKTPQLSVKSLTVDRKAKTNLQKISKMENTPTRSWGKSVSMSQCEILPLKRQKRERPHATSRRKIRSPKEMTPTPAPPSTVEPATVKNPAHLTTSSLLKSKNKCKGKTSLGKECNAFPKNGKRKGLYNCGGCGQVLSSEKWLNHHYVHYHRLPRLLNSSDLDKVGAAVAKDSTSASSSLKDVHGMEKCQDAYVGKIDKKNEN